MRIQGVERHFLDLCERLKQREGDADREPDQLQRTRRPAPRSGWRRAPRRTFRVPVIAARHTRLHVTLGASDRRLDECLSEIGIAVVRWRPGLAQIQPRRRRGDRSGRQIALRMVNARLNR